MEILATWSPIETYTALYIKAVRTRGYNKSLYSFVNIYGESSTIQVYAKKIMRGFVKTGLMTKTPNKQEYCWNKSGKYILIEDLHEFINKCLRSSEIPKVQTNKQMRYETQTVCEWKLLDRKLTPINRKERTEYILDASR